MKYIHRTTTVQYNKKNTKKKYYKCAIKQKKSKGAPTQSPSPQFEPCL